MSNSRPTPLMDLAIDRDNPINFGSTTLRIMSKLFINSQTYNNSDITIPKMGTPIYSDFLSVYSQWLALYIRDTLTGLAPIRDIEHDIEIIEVVKASVNEKESRDLEPAILDIKKSYDAIKAARSQRKEENSNIYESHRSSAHDMLKAPTIARTEVGTGVLTREQGKLDLHQLELSRLRTKEEELRVKAQNIKDSLAKRFGAEKIKNASNQIERPAITPPNETPGSTLS